MATPLRLHVIKQDEIDRTAEYIINYDWVMTLWRQVVILTLRYGNWIPPCWPILFIIKALRKASFYNAAMNLRAELGWMGQEDYSWKIAFLNMLPEYESDPIFLEACELALQKGRVLMFGLPVVLDEEIVGQGHRPYLLYIAQAMGRRIDPFPRRQ